jgi:hypothetical protein
MLAFAKQGDYCYPDDRCLTHTTAIVVLRLALNFEEQQVLSALPSTGTKLSLNT